MKSTTDSESRSRRISPELLLARIEEIQAELHAVLATDTLEGMEELTRELSSRLQSLTEDETVLLSDPTGARTQRVRRIGAVQRELAEYAGERLKAIGAELQHASASRALGHKYTIDRARAGASLLSCMDLEG